jgi:chromosome segregation ATPase
MSSDLMDLDDGNYRENTSSSDVNDGTDPKYNGLLSERDQLLREKQELLNELEGKRNLAQSLADKNDEILQLKKKTENQEDYRIQLEEKIKTIEEQKNDEISQLRKDTENLENYKTQLEAKMKTIGEQKDNEILKLKGKTENQDNYIIQLNEKMETLENQKNDEIRQLKEQLNIKINDLLNENENLQKRNKMLDDENSEWQNYIGKATTFSLNDSDVNHSAQLAKDIEAVQKKIADYVGNLRPRVDINYEEVNKLLRSYGCHAQVKSKEKELLLVKAVLQRHVLSIIFDEAKNYLYKNMRSHVWKARFIK